MIRVALFGKLCIECDGIVLEGCDSAKADELFCYLLLHRDRPHAREMLASLLWGDHGTTSQTRKYLRNSLWRLQTTLGQQQEQEGDVLLAEPGWIQLKTTAALWADVTAFERAYTAVKGIPGHTLTDQAAQDLEGAIQLYKGYLLESWYQEWCLCERERLHQICLIMLDKLMGYCEAHQRYEDGLAYGQRILQYDRAREHTHRHMMRLYDRSGNRTGALRQYEDCVATLKDELDVEPAEATEALYTQIRGPRRSHGTGGAGEAAPPAEAMHEVLHQLHQLQVSLTDMQRQIHHAEQVAKLVLESQPPGASDQRTLFS